MRSSRGLIERAPFVEAIPTLAAHARPPSRLFLPRYPRARERYGVTLPDWREGVTQVVASWRAEPRILPENNVSVLIPVILSGGAGTRLSAGFAPRLSQTLHAPAQRRIVLGRTLDRALAVADAGEVVTVTGFDYRLTADEYARSATRPFRSRLLLEPAGRNTAPAIVLAALDIAQRHGEDAQLLVLPADHLIRDVDAFAQDVAARAGGAGYWSPSASRPPRRKPAWLHPRRCRARRRLCHRRLRRKTGSGHRRGLPSPPATTRERRHVLLQRRRAAGRRRRNLPRGAGRRPRLPRRHAPRSDVVSLDKPASGPAGHLHRLRP